jgi:hypothetical protein
MPLSVAQPKVATSFMSGDKAMAAETENGRSRGGIPWRAAGWSVPVLLLLVPLAARWPWTLFDFVFMGVLFAGCGLALELAVRASASAAYRLGAAVAVATSFLLVWINGAVGIFGDEETPANLMFLGVVAVAVLGSVLARFRAAGQARAMAVAAAAQALAASVGLVAGLASPGPHGVREAVLAAGFALPWLVSAGLFGRAAEDQARA